MQGLPDWFQYGDEPAFPKETEQQEGRNVMTHHPYAVEVPRSVVSSSSVEVFVCDSMNTIIDSVRTVRVNPNDTSLVKEQLEVIHKTANTVLRKIQDVGKISPTAIQSLASTPRSEQSGVAEVSTSSVTPMTVTETITSTDAVDSQSLNRSCEHNNWDNVRARKGSVTLRCRTCQSQWRVPLQLVRRCPNFDTSRGCRKTTCNKLHVHRSKQSLSDRVESFGDGVLQKVPPHARPDPETSSPSSPTLP